MRKGCDAEEWNGKKNVEKKGSTNFLASSNLREKTLITQEGS